MLLRSKNVMIEYYSIFKILCLVHSIASTSLGSDYSNNNYWSDNFDENKNCVREKEMERLREEDPERCYTVSQGEYLMYIFVGTSCPSN